jgi:hypothetical protein
VMSSIVLTAGLIALFIFMVTNCPFLRP